MNGLAGCDYDWYCTDSEGNIGRMTTGGEGPIPEFIINNFQLIDKFNEYMNSRSEISQYQIYARDIYSPSSFENGLYKYIGIGDFPVADNEFNRKWLKDFILCARRGIFAYDWIDVQRPKILESNEYELMAAPMKPLTVKDIPEEFKFIKKYMFKFKFEDNIKVDIKKCFV